MNNNITLDKLPLNCSGIITNIRCDDITKRRFADLGLIPGSKIHAIMKSPFNDPTAFNFKKTVIALRQEDTKNIYINLIKENNYENP